MKEKRKSNPGVLVFAVIVVIGGVIAMAFGLSGH